MTPVPSEATACTEHPDNFMRNGGPYGRNRDQIFLSVFYAFPDRFRNFGRFAQAHTYMALTIANHNQCGKGEATAAFNNFCNAIDEDNFFSKAIIRFFTSVTLIKISQNPSSFP